MYKPYMIPRHIIGAELELKSKFVILSMSTVAAMLVSTEAEAANDLIENYDK